jgi:bifunctional non-homologous end joining protein LigD
MVAPVIFPQWFGPLEGRAATWAPVGLVILGGLTTSTFLTLVFVPTVYSLVDDAGPEDCVRALPGTEVSSAPAPTDDIVPPAWHDKVYFPDSGLTKADLHAYYRWAAPRILPVLRDRPVVLERFPEGIASGTRFFQKNAPEGLPGFVRVEDLPSGRRVLVCDDVETLLYLVSLATIPLHIEASRLAAPTRPDWVSLDLDAKSAPFAAAREVARAVQSLTDRLGLPAYVKTSGATGLHVLLPLSGPKGLLDHLQARQLAELLARVVVAELEAAGRPIASVERMPAARAGRVYVDFLQNGAGKLLAAPWCVRALPGAPVSMPLDWEELDGEMEPGDFTLRTVPDRVAAQTVDPWEGFFDQQPDLTAALAALGEVAGEVAREPGHPPGKGRRRE